MGFYKNIRLFYIIIFFRNLVPAYVIERLYWQARGMDLPKVVYCEIIYAIVIVALELPSGVWADTWGRRKMLLLGMTLRCAEFFLMLFAHSFWHFTLIIALTGLGSACESGAWNALLYDSLAAMGEQNRFETVVGRQRALDYGASMLAALCGGVLAGRFGLELNYWLSLVSALPAAFCTALLREPRAGVPRERPAAFRQVLRKALIYFKNHPFVLVVVAHSAAVAACIIYVDEFWQLYLENFSFPLELFGVVSVLLTLGRISGALIAGWLQKIFPTGLLLTGASLLTAAGIMSAAAIAGWPGMLCIVFALLTAEIMGPVAVGCVHREAEESARATIDSVQSLLERGYAALLGLVFAYIAQKYSVSGGFWLLGGVCGTMGVLFAVYYGKSALKKQS